VSTIPLRDVVVDSREQAALKHAQEDARGHQSLVVAHETLANHGCRPAHHDERQPDRWADALHHHVAGDFGSDIKGEQHRQAVVVLQPLQVQVLLEIVEAGIADVGAVEEAQSGELSAYVVRSHDRTDLQINQRHEGDDVPI